VLTLQSWALTLRAERLTTPQGERGQNHDESPKEKEQERERNYERGRRERRNTMWWGVVAD
jgi:hypothetical protein